MGLRCFLCFFLLTTVSSYAWWPRSSEAPKPKTSAQAPGSGNQDAGIPVASLNQEQASRFVELADARKARETELRVFRAVLAEKTDETQSLNDELKAKFEIDPADSYTFNPSNRVVFKIVRESTVTENPPAGETEKAQPDDPQAQPPDLRVRTVAHRQIEKTEDVDLFLRLVKARDMTRAQISALLLLVREKELELGTTIQRLKTDFAIEPDKHYRFDTATKAIIELPSLSQ